MIVLLSLIQPSGEVSGDTFGETDSRFTYILLNSLSLLNRLDDLVKPDLYGGKGREMLIENLMGCMNFDGGFGSTPGGESHGGQSGSLILLFSFFYLVLSITSSFFSLLSLSHISTFPLLIP
jgi:prenyltransferase beta subunit